MSSSIIVNKIVKIINTVLFNVSQELKVDVKDVRIGIEYHNVDNACHYMVYLRKKEGEKMIYEKVQKEEKDWEISINKYMGNNIFAQMVSADTISSTIGQRIVNEAQEMECSCEDVDILLACGLVRQGDAVVFDKSALIRGVIRKKDENGDFELHRELTLDDVI